MGLAAFRSPPRLDVTNGLYRVPEFSKLKHSTVPRVLHAGALGLYRWQNAAVLRGSANAALRLAIQTTDRTIAEVIAAVRGALHVLLHETPVPAPLIDAKEAARRLGVSTDYVRDHGAALDIEVWLDGVVRYEPARMEAARQRRRPHDTQHRASTLTDLLHST